MEITFVKEYLTRELHRIKERQRKKDKEKKRKTPQRRTVHLLLVCLTHLWYDTQTIQSAPENKVRAVALLHNGPFKLDSFLVFSFPLNWDTSLRCCVGVLEEISENPRGWPRTEQHGAVPCLGAVPRLGINSHQRTKPEWGYPHFTHSGKKKKPPTLKHRFCHSITCWFLARQVRNNRGAPAGLSSPTRQPAQVS